MNLQKRTFFVFLLPSTLGFVTLFGCNPDKSGDTQQMPLSASTPNPTPSIPSNLPPQVQKGISKSAPGAAPVNTR